ncbi:MAG: hypothetical protein A3F85_00395 [Candidatus Ryanbacteria bacterium RIFCSPLOWO2_12_FULL_44_26]|nr:MAG: hypothetical protein A2718_02925 [Candidatus Ryanbacteria bacterium RIFCSPHIGHO2_01_FULL_44_130]OGZ55159.1 MAG: hypothetical protein A3F85_00395 [Candidatus Ryanbacteria bacterium RIFCSPLOWO2_12_FULL_44_26]
MSCPRLKLLMCKPKAFSPATRISYALLLTVRCNIVIKKLQVQMLQTQKDLYWKGLSVLTGS